MKMKKRFEYIDLTLRKAIIVKCTILIPHAINVGTEMEGNERKYLK